MFTLTKDWLFLNYGSRKPGQVEQTKKWLETYGIDVPPDRIDEWSKWKHLSEYQVNTKDIVEQALAAIGVKFDSELVCHRWLNSMRVPGAAEAYMNALDIVNPTTILECGVGGDSAISTSIWLSHVENKKGASVVSLDRNPLDTTWIRYKKYPFWKFHQTDSYHFMCTEQPKGTRYDMVFIDTIHSYDHTTKELNIAQHLTNYILLDDVAFEGNSFDPEPGGVKRAIEVWLTEGNREWEYKEFLGKNVGLLMRKFVEPPKPEKPKLQKPKLKARKTQRRTK